MSSSVILSVEKLTKTFPTESGPLTVLRDVSFSVEEGTTCAIAGPSGSGKTTLLGLCAGLDRASSGSVILDGKRLESMTEEERARVRRQSVGFVFQNFQLIPALTALENVMVPLELRGEKEIRPRAADLLRSVGLEDRLRHYPAQLSGGEQQRVALARAFIHRPKILFADEPTGNLDAESSERVVRLLFELNRDAGTTLVLATHNRELAQRTQHLLHLDRGTFVKEERTSAAPASSSRKFPDGN